MAQFISSSSNAILTAKLWVSESVDPEAFEHAERVAELVRQNFSWSQDTPMSEVNRIAVHIIVAWIHDLVEDVKEITIDDVEKRFGLNIAEAVVAVTRNAQGKETYAEFIQRAKRNPIARLVKLADITDHLNQIHTIPSKSLIRRYENAQVELEKLPSVWSLK